MLLILVVDDEPDIEALFRQQFRRDLRAGRFRMDFAQSAPAALQSIADAADAPLILILSDINMPGMSGLELLPKAKAIRPDVRPESTAGNGPSQNLAAAKPLSDFAVGSSVSTPPMACAICESPGGEGGGKSAPG